MIETANNSILTLQSDLVLQQNLVVLWQQTAEDNRANLSGVDLSGTDLSGADLSGADLSGADLSGADLSGADLSYVTWYNTTCPDGTNSDDNGDTGPC